jgi:hypothetical protein
MKLKLKLTAAILIAGLCTSMAVAAPNGLGLGLILGEPTGFSLKYWTRSQFAFDAALGYSFWRYGQAFQVHGDLLWHSRSLIQSENGFLPLYIGIGARLKMADESHDYPDMRVGVRIPFGLEYVFVRVPVGLFLELVPIIDVMPGTDWGGNSAIGFRYYFGSH